MNPDKSSNFPWPNDGRHRVARRTSAQRKRQSPRRSGPWKSGWLPEMMLTEPIANPTTNFISTRTGIGGGTESRAVFCLSWSSDFLSWVGLMVCWIYVGRNSHQGMEHREIFRRFALKYGHEPIGFSSRAENHHVFITELTYLNHPRKEIPPYLLPYRSKQVEESTGFFSHPGLSGFYASKFFAVTPD